MTEREAIFYDVPEWDEVRTLCEVVDASDDAALAEKASSIDNVITDAIAACDMLSNKIAHLSSAYDALQHGEDYPGEMDDVADPDERLFRVRKKLENARHALTHLRARTNRLISAHGTIRALMGLDPVFTVNVTHDWR